MPKAYYDNTISGFLGTSDETILGRLMISDEFRTTIEQKNSWRSEIEILKRQLRHVPDGSIIFEYTIPRVGDRIDVTCIINGIIFALEFKVNNTEYLPADEEQVVDYALDLKYFHEESERRHIVPRYTLPAGMLYIRVFYGFCKISQERSEAGSTSKACTIRTKADRLGSRSPSSTRYRSSSLTAALSAS